MKYPDGSEARMGDRVRFPNGDEGTIVCSIDTDEYTAEFTRENWADLGSGVMIRTDRGALVRYSDPNDLVILISRKANDGTERAM